MKLFECHGLQCAVLKGPLGQLNGYVCIEDRDHPMFGVHYFDLPLDVHGGCTFSQSSLPKGDDSPDGWWIGFDTAHAGDFVPSIPHLGGATRDEQYVMGECEKLARQISCSTSG